MKHIVIGLMLLVLGEKIFAQDSQICESTAYIRSTPEERFQLLLETSSLLVTGAQESIQNLSRAKTYLTSCRSQNCENYQAEFLNVINEQIYISKIIKAILKKSRVTLNHRTRSPLTIYNVLKMIEDKTLRPSNIAIFDVAEFEYSNSDKSQALKLWTNVFIRMVDKAPEDSKLRDVIKKTNNYFKQLSYDMIAINPLLAFISERNSTSIAEIGRGFDKIIAFNRDFLSKVTDMETNHKTGFWSYLNLTLPDHEMGLVNFPGVITKVVQTKVTNQAEKTAFCSAWKDLERQQRRRIRSSIGVGFGTAVVCGVGIWSGVGTLPAAALCSFAIADGLWGARRGYLDSQIAQSSLYAGVKLYSGGAFTEGFLSPESSARQRTQGQIVFLINMLGLIPIGRAISTTVKNTRGSSLDLFKVPSADLTVSTIESGSSNIAYTTLVLRGSEALQSEFQDEISRLGNRALIQYAN